jgi:hypothetical protein
MNMSPIATDVATQMDKVVAYILGLNISPADKRSRLVRAFGLVGNEFFGKTFGDASEIFGSTAIGSTGFKNPEDQVERLATKLVRNDSLGRKTNKAIVKGFFDSVLADSQAEAFENARSMGRVPTLRRLLVGETCEWCRERANITWTNPDGELFARHDDCDCLFIVSGYNSRNGILTNYRKKPKKEDEA